LLLHIAGVEGVKLTRRRVWLIVFLFCVVFWGLVVATFAYAARDDNSKPGNKSGERDQLADLQKIKKLDLNDKQRKFIESLIVKPEPK
jgi:hypothetical protein